jgi:transposase-like protein
LKEFNKKTKWPDISSGQLIVIADAIIEFFGGKQYAVYFILVRSVTDSKAFILPPYMRAGSETALGWEEAFGFIPRGVLNRIDAIVCDGHLGLISLSKTYRWILQRCHFHLLASISNYISPGPFGKNREKGLEIKRLVETIIYQKNDVIVSSALRDLGKIKEQIISRRLKCVLSGFLRHYEDFRAYLKYPKYLLPSTTNSAEFLNSKIRDLQYRAKGFRTPSSFFGWVTGLCKYQKTVTCRPKINQIK